MVAAFFNDRDCGNGTRDSLEPHHKDSFQLINKKVFLQL